MKHCDSFCVCVLEFAIKNILYDENNFELKVVNEREKIKPYELFNN